MEPIPALLIIIASFIVTIGGLVDELRWRRYTGQFLGVLRGWHITSPTGSVASGCLSDTVVWIIGGLCRLMFIGGAILGVVVLDLIVFFSAFTEPR